MYASVNYIYTSNTNMFYLAVTMPACDEPTLCPSSYDSPIYIISLWSRGGWLVTCQIKCDIHQWAPITSEMPDWLILGLQCLLLVCVNTGKLVYTANRDSESKCYSEFCCNHMESYLRHLSLYIYIYVYLCICVYYTSCCVQKLCIPCIWLYRLEMLSNIFNFQAICL